MPLRLATDLRRVDKVVVGEVGLDGTVERMVGTEFFKGTR